MKNYRDLGGCYPPNSLIVEYFNSTSAIKISQKQTRPFRYATGVRQGCILSPLLFNLYINDLPSAFENTLSDPFALPNGAKLNFLKQDYKIAFTDKLSSQCTSWIMKINLKKTNIMVFQKRARKNAELRFLVDFQIIDVVQEYTYFRNSNLLFRKFLCHRARENIKEKALHAPFSSRRHTNLSKLKTSLACKIFDTIISPILTYNSEIWRMYAKPDFKTWDSSQIEKTHLQFCKRFPEVSLSNKASNLACETELGCLPLNNSINQKILNYSTLYILSLKMKNLSLSDHF